MAYKLAEYAGKPRLKLSSGKPILPRKQIFRTVWDGERAGETIGRADENLEGEPLIRQVMKAGKTLRGRVTSLGEAREHARRQVEMLPRDLRSHGGGVKIPDYCQRSAAPVAGRGEGGR